MSKFTDLKPGTSAAFWARHKQNAKDLLNEINQDVFSGSGEVGEDGSIYCDHGSFMGENITSEPNLYLTAKLDKKVFHFVIQLHSADRLQVVTAKGSKWLDNPVEYGWRNVKRWELLTPQHLLSTMRDAVKFHKL